MPCLNIQTTQHIKHANYKKMIHNAAKHELDELVTVQQYAFSIRSEPGRLVLSPTNS